MKRSVTRQLVCIMAGFIAIIAFGGSASAQLPSAPQTALETQNLAIPGPIMDAWKFVTDLGNELQSKLPKYSLINEKNAGDTIQQGIKSFNYTSLNDIFGSITTWYNNNVNLANAPGFIDKAVEIIKRGIELFAQGIKWLVGYL